VLSLFHGDSPWARPFGTELGKPKPAAFALEAATSVRSSSLEAHEDAVARDWRSLRFGR
jgi:hypothetical protein